MRLLLPLGALLLGTCRAPLTIEPQRPLIIPYRVPGPKGFPQHVPDKWYGTVTINTRGGVTGSWTVQRDDLRFTTRPKRIR